MKRETTIAVIKQEIFKTVEERPDLGAGTRILLKHQNDEES